MDTKLIRQGLMRQRAEQMRQEAREATVRASVMCVTARTSCLLARHMSSDNQRMLATARAGLQKVNTAS
ncbi:hypothetical protein [Streptomyces rimosus]|uniref:hypothetical protein n=1 Tax=Streptomyces rimosus TaxID=1927 RepID=UPI0037AF4EE7